MPAGLKNVAAGQFKRSSPEIDGNRRSVRKPALLHGPVRGEDPVVEHFAVARRAGDGRREAVAADEPLLVLGPLAVVKEKHAHRAVQHVEEVAFPPYRGELVVVVAPTWYLATRGGTFVHICSMLRPESGTQ